MEASDGRGGEIARAAAELAARAEELAARAREVGDVDEELAKLEAELATLDAERDRLDSDVDDLLEPPEVSDSATDRDPEEGFTFRLGDLGDRLAELVGAALSIGGTMRLGGHRDVVERDLHVDGARPVSVHSFAGSISVVSGSDDQVHVVAERHALDPAGVDAIDVDVTEHAGAVEVRAQQREGARRPRAWVKLTVSVPAGSPVRLRTQAGSVRVDGVGAEVACHTNGGSIRVTGSDGAAVLETAGGSIRLEDHSGPVTAHTMGGSIRLAGDLGPAVEAETIGGSIRIDGVDGSVAASTKGGAVSVSGRLSGTSSVETAGGSVSIALEAGTAIDVEGSGSSASTDVPGLHASGSKITGSIDGGGSGRLVARTIAGAIRIRRA